MLVKLGGSLKGAEVLLDELAAYPGPLAVVHGGGPQIGAQLEALGFTTRFEGGERVTPPEQLLAVEQVLTQLGKALAHGLTQRGRPAVGVSGRDAGFLRARAEARLGRVGRVYRVETGLLWRLLAAGYTPVVTPIAVDDAGALNVNADLAAAAVAGALAWPVIFFTDVPGVLADPEDPESRYPELDRARVAGLLQAGTIRGGMIPKVNAALAALAAGAPWAAIAPGEPGSLAAVLAKRAGTRLTLGPV